MMKIKNRLVLCLNLKLNSSIKLKKVIRITKRLSKKNTGNYLRMKRSLKKEDKNKFIIIYYLYF